MVNEFQNDEYSDFFEIWKGNMHTKYRKMLFEGRRDKLPCSKCNCDAKVHGFKHYNAWIEAWKK